MILITVTKLMALQPAANNFLPCHAGLTRVSLFVQKTYHACRELRGASTMWGTYIYIRNRRALIWYIRVIIR
jgi:hypothetical protein